MKNRIIILVLMMTLLGVVFPGGSVLRADNGSLPSTSYLEAEKQSYLLHSSIERSAAPMSMHFETYGARAASGWDDEDDEWGGWIGGGGHIGAPIGDVTPVVVVLLLIFYFVYRSVSISKRKNF